MVVDVGHARGLVHLFLGVCVFGGGEVLVGWGCWGVDRLAEKPPIGCGSGPLDQQPGGGGTVCLDNKARFGFNKSTKKGLFFGTFGQKF